MTHSLRPWIRLGPVLAAVFALFAAGCSSEPKPGPRSGGAPRRAFTPMAGQDSFFDDGILAEIHIGTEGMPEPQAGGGGGGNRGGGPGGRRRGGPGGASGQMSVAGGAGGFGGNIRGGVPFGEGGRPSREAGGGPRFNPGGGRPVLIHLRFTNRTDAAVELRISDFVSPLGNFVVRPEKLVIEPGEALETEPMSSQLAGAFTEVQATLVLHLQGRTERKTFPLRQVTPPEKPEPN